MFFWHCLLLFLKLSKLRYNKLFASNYKKQILQNIIGTFVFLSSQWIMLIFVVRIVDYHSAGMFSLAVALTNIFFVVSNYGLRGFQVSDINSEYTDQQYMVAKWISAVIGFLICLIFVGVSHYDSLQVFIIIIYMVYKSLESFSELFYGYYQNNNKFDFICISLVIKGVIQLTAFLTGLFLFSDIRHAIILMGISIFAVIMVYDLPRVKKYVNPLVQYNKAELKKVLKLLKVCLPLVVVSSATPLLQAIPRVFFENNYSSEAFGKFSSVTAPAVFFLVFITCLIIPLIPRFAEYYNSNNRDGLIRLILTFFGVILALGAVALVAVFFAGEFTLAVLFGEDIRPYTGVLKTITVATILAAFLTVFNIVFLAARKLVSLAVILLLGCGICYLVTPYFVGRFGMDGISYALTVSHSVQIIILAVVFFGLIYKMKKASLMQEVHS